jgi:phage tail-like protein
MSLLEYLPAIYQDPSDGDKPSKGGGFLGQFLLAFERVMLSGAKDPRRHASQDSAAVDIQSIEDEIVGIHLLFDAERTPERFLNWLASWVALALRSDVSVPKQRELIANITRLYRIRGTRRYLEEVLKLYLDGLPSVTDEDLPSLQIATHSTIGTDTYLGGGPSFLFHVKLALSQEDNEFVDKQRRLARDVIEMERPANTWYELRVFFPRLQLGVQSTVGVDTVLAPRSVMERVPKEIHHVD